MLISHNYDGLEHKLTNPSHDIIKDRILSLSSTALIYKVDISRAFRNLPVDPADSNYLGLFYDHNFYIVLAIPFGFYMAWYVASVSLMSFVIFVLRMVSGSSTIEYEGIQKMKLRGAILRSKCKWVVKKVVNTF